MGLLVESDRESRGTIRCGMRKTPPTFGGYPAQESFEPSTVVGRDVDRGIDAEPTGGLPSEHVIGDVALEQTATVEVQNAETRYI